LVLPPTTINKKQTTEITCHPEHRRRICDFYPTNNQNASHSITNNDFSERKILTTNNQQQKSLISTQLTTENL